MIGSLDNCLIALLPLHCHQPWQLRHGTLKGHSLSVTLEWNETTQPKEEEMLQLETAHFRSDMMGAGGAEPPMTGFPINKTSAKSTASS